MMNILKTICIFAIGMIVMSSGCGTDEPQPFPVEFEFRLLNSNGEVTTTFQEGEEIYFSLLFKNLTNEDVGIDKAFDCEDFFAVYKQTLKEDGTPLGFQFIASACNPRITTEEGVYRIPANGTREIRYSWSSTESECLQQNANLTIGNYQAKVICSFQGSGDKYQDSKKDVNFNLDFSVFKP